MTTLPETTTEFAGETLPGQDAEILRNEFGQYNESAWQEDSETIAVAVLNGTLPDIPISTEPWRSLAEAAEGKSGTQIEDAIYGALSAQYDGVLRMALFSYLSLKITKVATRYHAMKLGTKPSPQKQKHLTSKLLESPDPKLKRAIENELIPDKRPAVIRHGNIEALVVDWLARHGKFVSSEDNHYYLYHDEHRLYDLDTERWEAYYGKLPPVLKVRTGQIDDNVRINYARMIVDKGVSFLFGQDVGFEIDEIEETDAEQWLDAVWTKNRKMSLLQNAALVGSVTGHVFIKIVPAQPYPRLVVVDPETVTVSLAPDDIQQILSYQISYSSVDPKTKKPIGIRQVIERDGMHWWIVDQVGDLERLAWTTVNEAVWPYEFSPIVDCQNLPAPGEFWGQSDLEDDVIEIIRAINFIASNTARIIRFHAHPKTWGRGFTARDLRIGVDETVILPGENAELRNLEMQSDLASSLRYLDILRQALHEISRVPEVATGNLDRAGSLSGVALQILYQPLLEKTNTKRLLYGGMLVELNRRLLAIGGYGDDLHTALHWQDVLPQDPMQERQAALIDMQLGVSQDTLLQRLGYDPSLERQKQEVRSAELGEQILTAFDRGQ